MGKKEFILISRIIMDDRECDLAKAAAMSKDIAKNGMEFPITLTFNGTNYCVKDGYYRLVAIKALGQTHVSAKIEDY